MTSSGKSPANYLKGKQPLFKLVNINPGQLEYLADTRFNGILRKGWIPQKPEHFIYKQRLNSAVSLKKCESGHNWDGLPRVSAGQTQVCARPHTAHVQSTSQKKLITLEPIKKSQGEGDHDDNRPTSSNVFFSTSRVRQVQVGNSSRSGRMVRSASYRPISVCSERYLAVTPSPSNSSNGRRAADSEQARRLEEEWAYKEKCRLLKRMSETRDYRVDRLYYINGASCPRAVKQPQNNDKKHIKQIENGQLRIPSTRFAHDDDVTRSQGLFDDFRRGPVTSSDPVFLTQTTDESRDNVTSRQKGIDVAEVVSVELADDSDDDSIDDLPKFNNHTKSDHDRSSDCKPDIKGMESNPRVGTAAPLSSARELTNDSDQNSNILEEQNEIVSELSNIENDSKTENLPDVEITNDFDDGVNLQKIDQNKDNFQNRVEDDFDIANNLAKVELTDHIDDPDTAALGTNENETAATKTNETETIALETNENETVVMGNISMETRMEASSELSNIVEEEEELDQDYINTLIDGGI